MFFFFLRAKFNGKEGSITEKTEKRLRYLNKSADIICRSAYGLCRHALAKEKEKPPDAKELKDVCAAVKEAIAISASLDRDTQGDEEKIRVLMESRVEPLAK